MPRGTTPKPRKRRSRPSGSVTIQQVAAAAKVSVATVSRALQSPQLVAENSRRLVQQAVKQLGYTPNIQARNLRTDRTRMIVALVPDIANPFFSEIIRGVERVAHANQYSVLLGDTQYNIEREQSYANLVAHRQADGLITFSPHIPNIPNRKPLPLVNACEYVADKNIASVYVDNVRAAKEGVDYLIALGHRDIAFIAGRSDSPLTTDREKGYESSLAEAGLKRNLRLTASGDFSVESGIRAVESLFSQKLKFTAVFCSNDEMALGAMQAIKAKGLKIPDDISVIGFDDIHFARYADPPLTTLAQPKEELGGEAMTMLIEILAHKNVPARKRVLPAPLVIRSSTAKPRG
jgi:LacI family transcriptional regulator, repressor for deo operon, udp, cdd, tsx, nupC, and nupG